MICLVDDRLGAAMAWAKHFAQRGAGVCDYCGYDHESDEYITRIRQLRNDLAALYARLDLLKALQGDMK